MFRQLRADIDTATNSEKALDRLSIDIYDLVISDIGRDDERDLDGLQFLDKFRAFDKKTPLIFYIGVVDPDKDKPAQAFGITKRPDELLHLTLDALETKNIERTLCLQF